MSSTIEKITTNYYKTLKILFDNHIKTPDGNLCTVKQTQIAEKLGISKITMNAIFKELQQDSLVIKCENQRGKYILTDSAIFIIENMNRIEIELDAKENE